MKLKNIFTAIVAATLFAGCVSASGCSRSEDDSNDKHNGSSKPQSSASSNDDSSSNGTSFYYDMLRHRTLFNDNGSMYYNTNNGLCYYNISPDNIDDGPVFLTDDLLSMTYFCVVLNDYVYYSPNDYASTYSIRDIYSDCQIKRYNLRTSEVTDVVGPEGYGAYCLSDADEIYGMICTKDEYPVTDSNGAVSIGVDYLCSLVKINEATEGYDIIKTFSAPYEYKLIGVYENKAYFSKDEPSTIFPTGVVIEEGKKYGLIEYDIKTGNERTVYHPYEDYSGEEDDFYMALYKNKLTFFYCCWKSEAHELHAVDLSGNDTVVFSSKNQFNEGDVNIFDDVIYISVRADSGTGSILYKVQNGTSEILGIPEIQPEIIFVNPYTGALQYFDYKGQNYIMK